MTIPRKIVVNAPCEGCTTLNINVIESGVITWGFEDVAGNSMMCFRLTPPMARALILALAPLVDVFASDQTCGNGGDGKGIKPPADALKVRT